MVDFAIHNSEWSLKRKIKGLINFNPDREICELMALLEMGDLMTSKKRLWMLRPKMQALIKFGFAKLQTPPKRIGIQFLTLDILIHLNGEGLKC